MDATELEADLSEIRSQIKSLIETFTELKSEFDGLAEGDEILTRLNSLEAEAEETRGKILMVEYRLNDLEG